MYILRLFCVSTFVVMIHTIVLAMDTEKKNDTNLVYAMAFRQGDESVYEDGYFVRRGGSKENMVGHTLFSLFDGCGGCEVAQYLQKNLAKSIWAQIVQLRKNDSYHPDIRQVFDTSFRQTDGIITHNEELRYKGSTGLMIYIHDRKAYIGWLGDTRAVIIRNGDVIFSTTDHKYEAEVDADLAYLSGTDCESDCEYDETDIRELKLSRAFGVLQARHWVDKNLDFRVVDLRENDLIVLASKGVWSVMSNNEVAEFIAQHVQTTVTHNMVSLPQAVVNRYNSSEKYGENGALRDSTLLRVVCKLRDKAYEKKSPYNITAFLAAIRTQAKTE